VRDNVIFIRRWPILFAIFQWWWRWRSLYTNKLLLSIELSRKYRIMSASHIRWSHHWKHRAQSSRSYSIWWPCRYLVRQVGATFRSRNVKRIPHHVWLPHWLIRGRYQWVRRGFVLLVMRRRRYHLRRTVYICCCWRWQYHCCPLLVLLLLNCWSWIFFIIPVRVLLFIILNWATHRVIKFLFFFEKWRLRYDKWIRSSIINSSRGRLMNMPWYYSLVSGCICVRWLVILLNIIDWAVGAYVESISDAIRHINRSMVLIFI
jgi:hypothetical protein